MNADPTPQPAPAARRRARGGVSQGERRQCREPAPAGRVPALGELLASLIHELNQPLGRVASSLPVVFITSYEDPWARDRALRAGAVGFLVKPFDEEALLGNIARALSPDQGKMVVPSG